MTSAPAAPAAYSFWRLFQKSAPPGSVRRVAVTLVALAAAANASRQPLSTSSAADALTNVTSLGVADLASRRPAPLAEPGAP